MPTGAAPSRGYMYGVQFVVARLAGSVQALGPLPTSLLQNAHRITPNRGRRRMPTGVAPIRGYTVAVDH